MSISNFVKEQFLIFTGEFMIQINAVQDTFISILRTFLAYLIPLIFIY